MKNYLSIAQRWADVKKAILVEHERVTPIIAKMIADYKRISGQAIPAEHIGTSCKLAFYPYWEGFTYTYSSAWQCRPDVDRHWEWTLKEAQEVLIFLQGMNEEEVKIIFRQWAEKCCQ